jgi:hypothetical protein
MNKILIEVYVYVTKMTNLFLTSCIFWNPLHVNWDSLNVEAVSIELKTK